MSLPTTISAEAAVKSVKQNYISIFERKKGQSDLGLVNSNGDPKLIEAAVVKLKGMGFYILSIGKTSIHISAEPSKYEKEFGVTLATKSLDGSLKNERVVVEKTGSGFIDTSESEFKDLLAGVMLEVPSSNYNGGITSVEQMLKTMTTGQIVPWEIPALLGDVPKIPMNAPKKIDDPWPYHYSGYGVEVHVIDSGFHKEHSFFKTLYGKNKNQEKRESLNVPSLVEEIEFKKSILDNTIKKKIELLKNDIKKTYDEEKPFPKDEISLVLDQFTTQVFSEAIIENNIKTPNYLQDIAKPSFFQIDKNDTSDESNKKLKKFKESEKSKRLNKLDYLISLIDFKKSMLNEQLKMPEYNGHGTAAIANVLAVAPDVDLKSWKGHQVVKDIDMNNIILSPSPISQFDSVINHIIKKNISKPKVISCSWGENLESTTDNSGGPDPQILKEIFQRVGSWRDKIEKAIEANIVVVFAIGNFNLLKSLIAYTGDMDVIFVGGAYYKNKTINNTEKELHFSSFSHGYVFNPNDKVPTICGLCAPQQALDKKKPLRDEQVKDETQLLPGLGQVWCPIPLNSDGFHKEMGENWHPLHGTSFSAPQVAGVCAQILEVYKEATPKQVKEILTMSATPITNGQSAQGISALNLGVGLVNIKKATDYAHILHFSSMHSEDKIKPLKDLIKMRNYKKFLSSS